MTFFESSTTEPHASDRRGADQRPTDPRTARPMKPESRTGPADHRFDRIDLSSADLLPRELGYRFAAGARNQVRVHADTDAIRADWHRAGRVELMVAGRPLLLETDLDGVGVRVVEPVSRLPLAAFHPNRRDGRVDLANGAVLRWLRPSVGVFERGFVGWRDANVVRFAHDGTAIILVDLVQPVERDQDAGRSRSLIADPRRGWVPDVLVLVVLGWFILLLESEPEVVVTGSEDTGRRGVRWGRRGRGRVGPTGPPVVPAYPDLDGPYPDSDGPGRSPAPGRAWTRAV